MTSRSFDLRRFSLRAYLAPGAALLLLAAACHSRAQLTWSPGGTGGTGGTGTWNANAANSDWWNGSTNVPWVSGGDAVFAGASGTVTVGAPAPTVNSITFNTASYVVQSGTIKAGSTGLTITTNFDATISSTLTTSLGGASSVVKNGSGTLTVSGTNFLNSLQVNTGQYLLSGTSNLSGVDVALANTSGATVTLGQTSNSTNFGSLSGGGGAGGIVQPGTAARTVQLTLNGAGNFGGILQDNGSGLLALALTAGNNLDGMRTLSPMHASSLKTLA